MDWTQWRVRKVYEEPLQRVALAPGSRVLDIGGGAGEARPLAAEMGLGYVNLDLARSAQIDVVGSAEALPFSEGSFDAVVAVTVLQHIRDVPAALGEAARVLRPRGVAIIVQGNRWSYTLHWLRHRTGVLRGQCMRHYQTYDAWSAGDWHRHLLAAGLCDIRIDYRGWLPEMVRTYTRGGTQRALVRIGQATEWVAEAIPLLRRAAVWMIITSRKALAS